MRKEKIGTYSNRKESKEETRMGRDLDTGNFKSSIAFMFPNEYEIYVAMQI